MFNLDELKNIKNFEDKLYGYVYVIDNGINVKIGCTSNLYNRMKSLSNSNSGGNVIKEIYYSPSSPIYRTIEKLMHEKFSKYNSVGEWYKDISYKNVCNYLDALCNSPGFKRCSEERERFIEDRKRNNKICSLEDCNFSGISQTVQNNN